MRWSVTVLCLFFLAASHYCTLKMTARWRAISGRVRTLLVPYTDWPQAGASPTARQSMGATRNLEPTATKVAIGHARVFRVRPLSVSLATASRIDLGELDGERVAFGLHAGGIGWPLLDDGRVSNNLSRAIAYGVPVVTQRRFLEWIGKVSPAWPSACLLDCADPGEVEGVL